MIVLGVLIIFVMQNKHFIGTPNEFSYFESFDQLAKDTFDLSFKEWKEAGYLTQKYRPYTHIEDGKVVANASANLMDFVMEGQRWSAIQIGTVMTEPKYRNQGLAKTLIQQIIDEWSSKVDFIYLFSNDDTTSFYPQFGFERVFEYAYSRKITMLGTPPKYRKLNMSDESDLSILKEKYRIGNPFSVFESVHNFELLLFYCGSFMSESVYYLEDYDLVVILQKEENTLRCFEVYGEATVNQEELFKMIQCLSPNVNVLELGFTPKVSKGLESNRIESYDHLFILNGEPFAKAIKQNRYLLPLLSHA